MPVSRYLCIFINVGLGEAAKRDVGTGENQIPDMVSFSGVRDFYGKQLLPGGLILQWLTIPSSAAVKAVTLDNGNYQLSGYKWPQSFGVDVYKRQIHPFKETLALHGGNGQFTHHRVCCTGCNLRRSAQCQKGGTPVSYTHLDVYKRQC